MIEGVSVQDEMVKIMESNSPFTAKYLGTIKYNEAVGLMNKLRQDRLLNKINDQLLFLEHPPVITSGRRDSMGDLHLEPNELRRLGIQMIKTDRGGRLTYHGPGQLIIYFVCHIEKRGLSVDRFIWMVEEGLRLCLESFAIKTSRDPKNPGLWFGKKKIASLGFHIHKGVTTHGASLNVSCDLTPFTYIIPCGIKDTSMTNMLLLMNKKVTTNEIIEKLVGCYSKVFGCEINRVR